MKVLSYCNMDKSVCGIPRTLITYMELTISIILLFIAGVSDSFNVYVPSSVIHRGPVGSYFGFSVEQHIDLGNTWLLVGAPKANTSQPGVVEGGYVYRCRENAPKNPIPADCQPVPLDTRGNSRHYFGNNILGGGDGRYYNSDEKSHQWLGASVHSARGVIVACAPRYVYFTNKFNKREPVGTCFVLSPDSSTAKELSPCRDEVMYSALDFTDQFGFYGSCQLGWSARTQDGQLAIMGAVGSHYWQGQVFAQKINESTFRQTFEHPATYDDTYLGYAIAIADFTGDGGEDYAVSIPKADELKGRVTILNSQSLMPMFNVSGEQLGEYFGYSVGVSDVNGDGLSDLIVGAPLYSQYRAGMYESGRVFVFYQNSQSPTRLLQSDKSIIEGSMKARARFGTAVTGLRDINKDTYEDFAVGAPYDGEANSGAVYIFHGSKVGVRKKPSQVIFASEIDRGLRTFAFSIAGGHDMDDNAYPDILIGAYASDAAVYLKSRPVVQVSVEIKVIPNIVKLDEKTCQLPDGTPVVCFRVEACLSFGGVRVPPFIELETTLRLDAEKPSGQNRALFRGGVESEIGTNLTLSAQNEKCSHYDVYLKNAIRDKLSAIDIDLDYRLINLTRYELPPILDEYIPAHIQTQADIWKNCGPDNICIPDLKLKVKTKIQEYRIGSSEQLRLDIDVRNTGEDAFEASVTLPLPSGVSYASFSNKDEYSNVRCGSVEADSGDLIICDIGNPFQAGDKTNFVLKLDLSKVNGSQQFLYFDFLANSSNKENSTDIKNNYYSIPIEVKVVADIRLTGVSKPEQILFNISVGGDPTAIEEIGPQVVHLYEVRNLGPSAVNSTILTVFWPSLLGTDQELLYLTHQPKVTEGSGQCQVHNGINKHNLKTLHEQHRAAEAVARRSWHSRKKRSTDVAQGPAFREIKCSGESEWCTIIRCNIGPMAAEENTLVNITSRLWIKSFKQTGLSSAFIYSVADAHVVSVPYEVRPAEYPVDTFQIKTYAGDLSAGVEKKPVAWWIIALAIGLGFMVLLLLIMALYKCGFFKRDRFNQKKGKEKNGSPPQNGNTSKHSSPPGMQTPSRHSSPSGKLTPSRHSSPSVKYDAIPSSEL